MSDFFDANPHAFILWTYGIILSILFLTFFFISRLPDNTRKKAVSFFITTARYIMIIGCIHVVSSIRVQILEAEIYRLRYEFYSEVRRFNNHKHYYETGEPCNAAYKPYE